LARDQIACPLTYSMAYCVYFYFVDLKTCVYISNLDIY